MLKINCKVQKIEMYDDNFSLVRLVDPNSDTPNSETMWEFIMPVDEAKRYEVGGIAQISVSGKDALV